MFLAEGGCEICKHVQLSFVRNRSVDVLEVVTGPAEGVAVRYLKSGDIDSVTFVHSEVFVSEISTYNSDKSDFSEVTGRN